jgi:acetoin utilization deacetylase AcuC-like enzyme
MKVVYSPRYHIDLGQHVFPTRKYELVRARLLEAGVIQPTDIVEPPPASWDELALVHTREYLTKMRHGTLSDRRCGTPTCDRPGGGPQSVAQREASQFGNVHREHS